MSGWNKVRWPVAIASLGAAFWAQKIANDDRVATNGQGAPPLLSWILFGVAALLFVAAVPATPAPIADDTTPFLATLRAMSKSRRRLFLGLAGVALLCDIAAVPLFFALNSGAADVVQPWPVNTGPWVLYIASLLLLATAWIVWERSVPPAGDLGVEQKPLPQERAGMRRSSARVAGPTLAARIAAIPRPLLACSIAGMLFLLALSLRAINLDSAPPGFWFDEAQNGIVARGLLAPNAVHPTFIGGFTQMGAFYFYILGIVLKLLGETSIWPLRLIPAFSGALLVPMLYAIGSRLYGWRVGIAAAVLLAVSGWNITFSRFGMASLPTVALDVGAYLCLLQGLRTGRLGYYAGAGVLLGLGLQMYYASELTPVVLGLVFLHQLITGRMRFWRSVRAGILVLAVSTVVAFLPVATFIVQQPEVFATRAGTVSIFSPEGSDGRPDALSASLNKYLLMFNYAGDINGRHNIPLDPMLDWWTGALFIAGVGVCFLRIRRWHYFYPLIWMAVAMSGGVLTVIFEAPQAHRTLENSVVTALIAGIVLGELSGALTPRFRGAVRSVRRRGLAMAGAGVSFALLAVVLVLAGAANIDHYFNRQLNNQGVWLEMLGSDRAIAEDLVKYGGTRTIFVSDAKSNYATSTYRAPKAQMIAWPGMFIFPLVDPKDTELLLTPADSTDVVTIKRSYPNATVDVLYGPDHSDPQLFQIGIPAGDIAALHGVHAIIYPKGGTGQPLDETLATVGYDWGSQDAQARQAGSIRLSSTLKVEGFGSYDFQWVGQDGKTTSGSVAVDGYDVTSGRPISLGVGLHSVVVTSTASSQAGITQLLMGSSSNVENVPISGNLLFDPRKIEPHGLTATMRPGTDATQAVALSRVDSTISFFFHVTPLPRPYTVEWAGKIYAPVAGTYAFHTEQISQSQLFIDGHQLIANSAPNHTLDAQVDLAVGLHDISLRFLDKDGSSHMYLYWTPPGMSGNYIIPSAFLLPVMGSYPAHLESVPWPGIDQADDSIWAESAEARAQSSPSDATPLPTPAQQVSGGNSTPLPTPQEQPTPAPQVEGQTPAIPMQPLLAIGQGAGTINRPKAAAVDGAGNIYIYTEGDTSISKFGPDGKLVKKWDVREKDNSPATEISALVLKDGKLLALDASTSELVSFNLDGTGGDRTHLCTCFFARGLSISNDGNFWVADTGGNRVIKVSPDGKLLASLEGKGSEPGRFAEPAGVWEAPDGTLYVADITNGRMQSFTPDLKPVAAWPMGKSTPRDGNRVIADRNGALVTEYDSKVVVRFDAQGKELGRWAYSGASGALIPAGITPAGGGKVLVLYPYDNLAVLFDPGQK